MTQDLMISLAFTFGLTAFFLLLCLMCYIPYNNDEIKEKIGGLETRISSLAARQNKLDIYVQQSLSMRTGSQFKEDVEV